MKDNLNNITLVIGAGSLGSALVSGRKGAGGEDDEVEECAA